MFGLLPPLKASFDDNNGNPLTNGRLYSYIAGSTTPVDTFTDATGSTANDNPIVLDARGEADVWLSDQVVYKFVLEDSLGTEIYSVDNVRISGGSGGGSSTDELVKVSVADVTAGYLADKLVAGNKIILTTLGAGSLESLRIALDELFASDITNDSTVSGVNVRDALNQLKSDIDSIIVPVTSVNGETGDVIISSGDIPDDSNVGGSRVRDSLNLLQSEIDAIDLSGYVTISTDQTITGTKTLTKIDFVDSGSANFNLYANTTSNNPTIEVGNFAKGHVKNAVISWDDDGTGGGTEIKLQAGQDRDNISDGGSVTISDNEVTIRATDDDLTTELTVNGAGIVTKCGNSELKLQPNGYWIIGADLNFGGTATQLLAVTSSGVLMSGNALLPDLSGYVTIDTTQTITGAKTFGTTVNFQAPTNHLGFINLRQNAYIDFTNGAEVRTASINLNGNDLELEALNVGAGAGFILNGAFAQMSNLPTQPTHLANKQYVDSVAGGGAVDSVFGRTGVVIAQASDYDASQVDNDSTVTGAFVSNALDNLLSDIQTIQGQLPATFVESVNGQINVVQLNAPDIPYTNPSAVVIDVDQALDFLYGSFDTLQGQVNANTSQLGFIQSTYLNDLVAGTGISITGTGNTRTITATGGGGGGFSNPSIKSFSLSDINNSTNGANTIYALKFVAPYDMTADEIGIYLTSAGVGDTTYIGIYNEAETLLASASIGNGVANDINLTALGSTALTGGSEYWFAVKNTTGANNYGVTSALTNAGICRSRFYSTAGLPASLGGSASSIAPFVVINGS